MENRLTKNIKIYYLFQLLREPLFWGAIIIAYIQKISGISLAEIFLMESVCIGVSVILQIPTGSLADCLGRRRLMIIGYAIMIAAIAVFTFATGRLGVWLADIILFAGCALVAGADNALLYDTLKLLKREHDYKKILGRTMAYRYLLSAGCLFFSGYLAEINLRLPIGLGLLPMAVAWVSLFFLYEPPSIAKKPSIIEFWWLMKQSVIFVANHSRLKWLILFIALIGVVSKLWFFTYNPYFEEVGLPLRYYGWLFALLNLVAAGCSFYADKISRALGDFRSIVAIILCQSVPIILMGMFIGKGMTILILFQNFVRGYFNPFLDNFLNHYLDSKNRATVLSVKSAVNDFACLIFSLAFSFVLSKWALTQSIIGLGIFSFSAGIVLIVAYLKIFNNQPKPNPSP